MGNKYNEQDINRFFENFRNLKNIYDLEKVHRLINNPDAKATQKVKFYYKPLNFIIMTSLIMILVSAVLFWPEPEKEKIYKYAENSFVNDDSQINKDTNTSQAGSNIQEIKIEKKKIMPDSFEQDGELKKESSAIVSNKIQGKETEHERLNSNKKDTLIKKEWTPDTVLDGSNFIVRLTNDELVALGYMLDNAGIYYFNLYNGDSLFFHSRTENGRGEFTRISSLRNKYNKKNIPSNHNFYPIIMSSPDYLSYDLEQEEFDVVNDTLLPIFISGEQLNRIDGVLVWFKITDDLFDILPQRYFHLKANFRDIKRLKMSFENIDVVEYNYNNLLEGIKLIELNKDELSNIGFVFKNKEITAISSGECFWEISLIKGGQRVQQNPDLEYSTLISNVVFLSNMLGQQSIKWKCENENTDKWKYDYFVDNMEGLIPILLKKEIDTELILEDQIFWVKPTQALFDALPEEIGDQLRKEYNYIQAKEQGVKVKEVPSCTYFEACKSTLKLDDLSIYPNPVSETVRIDFSQDEAIDGRISLVNISGSVLKVIVPQTTFMSGLNSYEANLSDVSPGIYLITINTGHGFKTQRIIVSR